MPPKLCVNTLWGMPRNNIPSVLSYSISINECIRDKTLRFSHCFFVVYIYFLAFLRGEANGIHHFTIVLLFRQFLWLAFLG